MDKVLNTLEPQPVFHYFEEICEIPHGSFDTKRIASVSPRSGDSPAIRTTPIMSLS